MTHALPDTLARIDYTYAGVRFFLARSAPDVEACRDLTFERVGHADYGCLDVASYREAFADTSRHVFLAARRDDASGDLLGTYRLQPGYALASHEGLEDRFGIGLDALAADPGRVADVASFIVPGTSGAARAAGTWLFSVTWIALFRLVVRYCHVEGIEALYIQSRPERARTYAQVGFLPVGPEFVVPGWCGSWAPMLLRLDEVRSRFGDPVFAREHRERTGVRLRGFLWEYFLTDNLPAEHLLMLP